ncbi:unnamed protein product [Lupinus luteus]|uniref:MADS-box domain-containing protein n=1 Tax=Lupinus luteus TaxID=3873 RepID=A0AAV1VWB0_LUPLU
MAGKKLNLGYIASDSKRNTTYKKRKNGLIKKMDEITTLCGIEACAIIYNSNEPEPEAWPSHLGAQRVLYKFSRVSQMVQSKKMFNQESFLNQSIMKAQEKLKKLRNENRKKEMDLLMYQCLSSGYLVNNVGMANLNDLQWKIDQTLKEIERNATKDQPQERSPMVTNRGEVINEENENVAVNNRFKGMVQNNIDVTQNRNWCMDSANGGGNEMLRYGELDHPNGGWNDIFLT